MAEFKFSMVEIPVVDFDRACKFYGELFDLQITPLEMNGMKMGFLKPDYSVGMLVYGEGYVPNKSSGIVIYFEYGDDLQPAVDKALSIGGNLICPKVSLGEGNGFMSHIEDTEGNKIGLWSEK